MRKLLFSFLVLSTIYTSSAAWSLPDWILPELNRYPIETFLFEVGESYGIGEEAFERAVADADRKVATRILSKVERIIRYNKTELEYDMVREHYSAVLEDYCTARQRWAALQLEGFSVRNLSVDLARTDQNTYALVYIEREKLRDIYANHALNLHQEIKLRLEIAKAAESNYDRNGAVKTYLRTYPLYEALKEAEIVQIGAEYAPYFSNAFRRLADATTYTSDDSWTHRQVIKRVEQLEQEVIVNFDDISRVVNSQLSRQIHPPSDKVSVHPLVYEDSEMISPFAREFGVVLHERLGWVTVDAVHNFNQTSPDISNINKDCPPLRFGASCWKNGDEVTIRATLRDVNTGKFLASAVVRFLNSRLRAPLTYKPSNHKQARIESEAFEPRYFVIPRDNEGTEPAPPRVPTEYYFSPVGGLKVDIWTDKGQNPMYYKGETMKVFGSVNQPAYLRLLYILADDRKYTLLKDNYYIDPSRVNSDIEIGKFVCTSPFGGEVLVVAARTEKFPPIQTYEENGYIFLEDQDAESAAQSFRALNDRGMQETPDPNGQQFPDPHQNEAQEPPDFQQSEAQIVVVTMER